MVRMESIIEPLDQFDPSILLTLNDPKKIPAHLLPWLAINLSLDVWVQDWNEEEKRKAIEESLKTHRLKGSSNVLKQALKSLDIGAKVEEWFEYGGEPYRFRVHLTQGKPLDLRDFNNIYMTIAEAKNLRSWLDKIIAYFDASGVVRIGGSPTMHHHVKIFPMGLKPKNGQADIYAGGAVAYQTHIRIESQGPKNHLLETCLYSGGGSIIQEKIYVGK